MAKVYTADEIVALARQKAQAPKTGATGSLEADLLAHANEFLLSTLAPLILARREDYFARARRTALVAATSHYPIEPRAMLGATLDVRYVNGDGNYQGPLEYIDSGDVDELRSETTVAIPLAFWLEDDSIRLWPDLSAAPEGWLEQFVAIRPGELVLVTNARRVETVDSTTQVTLTETVPSTWVDGSVFDVHAPASGARLRAWSKTGATVSGTGITFATFINGSIHGERAVAAGDYVCLEEECAVPPVPKEFHPLIATAAASLFCESIGDHENHARLEQELQRKLQAALEPMKPRVVGKPKKIRGTPYSRMQGRKYIAG